MQVIFKKKVMLFLVGIEEKLRMSMITRKQSTTQLKLMGEKEKESTTEMKMMRKKESTGEAKMIKWIENKLRMKKFDKEENTKETTKKRRRSMTLARSIIVVGMKDSRRKDMRLEASRRRDQVINPRELDLMTLDPLRGHMTIRSRMMDVIMISKVMGMVMIGVKIDAVIGVKIEAVVVIGGGGDRRSRR